MKEETSFAGEPATAYSAKTISIHEAKTNFSKLVKRAEAGEIIYIGAYGKPAVTLSAVDQREINAKLRAQAFGCMKGKYELPKDFDASLTDEEIDLFYSDEDWQGITRK